MLWRQLSEKARHHLLRDVHAGHSHPVRHQRPGHAPCAYPHLQHSAGPGRTDLAEQAVRNLSRRSVRQLARRVIDTGGPVEVDALPHVAPLNIARRPHLDKLRL